MKVKGFCQISSTSDPLMSYVIDLYLHYRALYKKKKDTIMLEKSFPPTRGGYQLNQKKFSGTENGSPPHAFI